MFSFLKKLFSPEKPAEAEEAPLQKGGYGGPCIPGDDLPDSIPRIPGPPTMGLIGKSLGGYRKGPPIPGEENRSLVVTDDFNFTNLTEVKKPDNTRAASITNGYDRDILLESPVFKLFLKKGETRTVKGPIFERAPSVYQKLKPFDASQFSIVGYAAVDVLRDMAAERTRAILRNEPPEKWATDLEFAAVDEILKLSKFTVTELPDGITT